MGKPILCLDFDGVAHKYTSGWQGATNIPDEYVPGLFEFLEAVKDDFDVQIFSSRSHQEGGVEAMVTWFMEQRKLWRWRGNKPPVDTPLTLSFPKEKPPAMISLDDRCLTFEGFWPPVEYLREFKPWYLRERVEMHDAPLPKCCDECGDHGSLMLVGECHPEAPTWAILTGDVLTIECAECRKPITRLRVTGEVVGI